MITLSVFDLSLAALLVLILAALSWHMRLGLERSLLIATLRMVVQLSLIGLVLKTIFATTGLLWVSLMALVMLLAAGREVMARQQRRLKGWWGYGLGTGAMFISSFAVTVLALFTMIGNQPWYEPQYAIPLLGMMLGNTMSGIALALDRLTQTAWQAQRHDAHHQRHGRRRHRQPAGHDDRPDPRRGTAHGGGEIPDFDHVFDSGGDGVWCDGRPVAGITAAVRRAAPVAAGCTQRAAAVGAGHARDGFTLCPRTKFVGAASAANNG